MHTYSFQFELNCAPPCSDVIVILQFQSTGVVRQSASEVVNTNLSALSLCRRRYCSPTTAYHHIVRLFELNVP